MDRSNQALDRILESARRLGVEMDEAEARRWIRTIAFEESDELVVDAGSGVAGFRVTLQDFDPRELRRIREVAEVVGIPDRPGIVETALALSGSAAQSRIQPYPGDCDFFERVNIKAPTREDACRILGEVVREKALSSVRGPAYQLIEVKFGAFPCDVHKHGKAYKRSAPIPWQVDEVRAGRLQAARSDGAPAIITWEEAAMDPAWCKLDWIVADPVRGQLALASNVLDATWEAPDSTITPLDGWLDPYFQEVYLEVEAMPLLSKVARHMAASAVDGYVARLEAEVRKYVTATPNYGKAAKRMYNIFRLTGRYEEAAYLRELFDEPTAALYQAWSLVGTLDEAWRRAGDLPKETLIAQTDQLMFTAVKILEGTQELAVLQHLLRLRDGLRLTQPSEGTAAAIEGVREEILQTVNRFFGDRLMALPSVRAYLERLLQGPDAIG